MEMPRDANHPPFALQVLGFEPPLQQVADGPMSPVEKVGVTHLQPADGMTQVRFRGSDHEMVMIVHQDKRMDLHPESIRIFGHQAEELSPVVVPMKNPLLPLFAIDHVILSSRNQNAQGW